MCLIQRSASKKLAFMMIFFFNIILSTTFSFRIDGNLILHDHDHHRDRDRDDHFIRQESGYHLRAYPFYNFGIHGGDDPHHQLFSNSTTTHDHHQEEEEDHDHHHDIHPFTTIISNNRRFSRLEKKILHTFNVDNFGAKGDGITDDTQAFVEAWKAGCLSSSSREANYVNIVVSKDKKYVVKQIRFTGPCKSSEIRFQIFGTIEASDKMEDYSTDGMRHWIVFDGVKNLAIEGGGVINGNGNVWWQNSCKITNSSTCNKHAPTAVTIYKSEEVRMENMEIKDSQQMHLSFEKCINVEANNLRVNAPETSPNTDGIHITGTQNIHISNSIIRTGDDCISIVSGSNKVKVTGITCGPGHGISIGSLGSGNTEAHVSDVVVDGADLTGTTNGVRIKTWQGGSGNATNIKFHNLNMHNVKNPIIIDQNYCDQDTPCSKQESAVEVKNVVYQNIKGTSATNVAINLDCSDSFPCQGIIMQNIDLVSGDDQESTVKAVCNNVRWINAGAVSPVCPSYHYD